MSRFLRVAALACVAAVALSATPVTHAGEARPLTIGVRLGTDSAGLPTEEWLRFVRELWPERATGAGTARPLTSDERQWVALIRTRAAEWPSVVPALAAAYQPVPPPSDVAIVLGNRAGGDAFTPADDVIAFDLSVLQDAYGSATSAGNAERVDRLFRHEFSHLLQKAWLRRQPYEAATPFRAALLGLWLEGLGTFHSMSQPWRAANGVPSRRAAATLNVLQPRFCTRLAALSCSRPEDSRRLTADLNEGPFDRKWGSLPIALWLEQEMSVSPDGERRLIVAGPDGILDLAKRHLTPELAAVLSEIELQASICAERSTGATERAP